MTLTIYHNPRCSTSRNVLALIEARGLKPKVRLYLDDPLTVDEIKALLKKLKLSAQELLRKREAAPLGLDTDAMTEAQLIAAMAKHPVLIQRPVVVNGRIAVLARPPEAVLTAL